MATVKDPVFYIAVEVNLNNPIHCSFCLSAYQMMCI